MGHTIVLICSFLAITLVLLPRRKRDVGAPAAETPKHAACESLRSAPPAVNAAVAASRIHNHARTWAFLVKIDQTPAE